MVKAIIFDCFGVILTDALQAMHDELALTSPDKAAEIKRLVLTSSKGSISPDESNRKIAELLGLSYKAYQSQVAIGEKRNEPLLDYIMELRKTYKTAMLSNVSSGGLLRRFKIEELEKYFDTTVASAEIGFAKPEPEAYEIVADRLRVRLDECVFTDDREEYCAGARAVGMQAFRYETYEQCTHQLSEILQTS